MKRELSKIIFHKLTVTAAAIGLIVPIATLGARAEETPHADLADASGETQAATSEPIPSDGTPALSGAAAAEPSSAAPSAVTPSPAAMMTEKAPEETLATTPSPVVMVTEKALEETPAATPSSVPMVSEKAAATPSPEISAAASQVVAQKDDAAALSSQPPAEEVQKSAGPEVVPVTGHPDQAPLKEAPDSNEKSESREDVLTPTSHAAAKDDTKPVKEPSEAKAQSSEEKDKPRLINEKEDSSEDEDDSEGVDAEDETSSQEPEVESKPKAAAKPVKPKARPTIIPFAPAPAVPTPAAPTPAASASAAPVPVPAKPVTAAPSEHKSDVMIPFAPKRTVTSILDLQPNKVSTSIQTSFGKVTLINLNPDVNIWYVLKLESSNGRSTEFYHFENIYPKNQLFTVRPDYGSGIVITKQYADMREEKECPLWSNESQMELRQAKSRNTPYVSLCEDKLYLRNKIEGYRTTKEWVVEFLRDNVWGGEAITDIVKKTIFKDKFLDSGSIGSSGKASGKLDGSENFPRNARINQEFAGQTIHPKELSIAVNGSRLDAMSIGEWYETKKGSGIFVSVIQAKLIAPDILSSYSQYVSPLDAIESAATDYLIAFDMTKVDLKFALGTEHPRLDWSPRTLPEVMVRGTKGPDGINNSTPLVATGLINLRDSKDVIATFTGGFKRSHSGFKWGELAKINKGSHYGFLENGVLFSTLNPHLATITVDINGDVQMRSWTPEDDFLKMKVKYARQNGVPIIDTDPTTQLPKPGAFVSNWTKGNWSGSNDQKFRALRAGLCLARKEAKKFLIYGYFTSVTPAAMARVFQAYQCEYAMHLDMNAPEHTYLAIYTENSDKGGRAPQQLTDGMKVLDERFKGNVPRFIGYPDNRDFFYLIKK
jgi:hypothetical protein